MKTKMTANDVTPAVISAVNAVLMARAYAETMREKIDKIQRAILEECPLKTARKWLDNKMTVPEYITDPKLTYLGEDSHCEDYFAECNKRERAAGLKPNDMPDTHCPALVADDIQRNAEYLLLECAGEMLEVPDFAELANRRLETRKQAIDLLCGLVVNMPGYKNPLTGKAA